MKKVTAVKILIILLSILTLLLFQLYEYNKEPYIKKYIMANKYNEDKTMKVTLNIKKFSTNKVYCKFILDKDESKWIEAKNNKCSYNIKTGKYIIRLKYNKDREVDYSKKFDIDGILGIKINKTKKYIAINDGFNVDAKIDFVGKVDEKITYTSSNPKAVTVDDKGNVRGVENGKATITATSSNGLKDSFDITSTWLIRPKVLDNNKDKVTCHMLSDSDVAMLDDILASEVEEAGPGTRAAVAVVSRFLTLEFPWKVPYFYENGRLTENGRQAIVDGEGRWYHKGLYIGQAKENTVSRVMAGPASWGCNLMNYEDDGYRKPNTYYPNGLDCSGYVSWVMVNAGMDFGDIGAGINPGVEDYTDLGNLQYNSYELLHSGNVHVGDLIGWDGHIAIIAAMSDTSIYVTESLLPGVIMDEYDYSSPYSRFYSRYDYIIDMSSRYKGDGNLQNMW